MSLSFAWQYPAVRAQRWWIVDAFGHRVGRLASQIPKLLQGKWKPTFNASADAGDYVVVINAKHTQFTGRKLTQKYYRWHTGWVGGLKQISAKELYQKKPGEVLRKAVLRMLPKSRLRKRYDARLLIYPEGQHPHIDKKLVEFIPLRTQTTAAPSSYIPKINTVQRGSIESTVDSNGQHGVIVQTTKNPAPDTHEKRKLAYFYKAAGELGKAHAWKHQSPDFLHSGPPVNKQEYYLMNKLIKTGYDGKNWPWAEVTPKTMSAEQLAVMKKVMDAPITGHPRNVLTPKENSVYDKVLKELQPKNYFQTPEFKKQVAAELANPKVVGEKALKAKAQLDELLSKQKARRLRHSIKNYQKKAAAGGAKPTPAKSFGKPVSPKK